MKRRASEWLVIAITGLLLLVFVMPLRDVRLFSVKVPRALPPPSVQPSEKDARLSLSVVDEAGLGISGATAQIFWERSGRYYLVRAAALDGAGKLNATELPRGVSWVLAEAPGYARASSQVILDERGRELRLVLAKARELKVTVKDEFEKLLPKATVLVTTGDPLPYGALTGEDGIARFARLHAPPWTVKVSAPGYESVTRAGVDKDLEVSLRRLGSIEILVQAADGKPSANATVSIAGPTLWPARTAQTNEQGVTRIAGLLAGSYDLRASNGGYVSRILFGFELARGAHEKVTLKLEPGRMVTALVTEGEGESPVLVSGADVVLAESGLSSFPLRGRTGSDGKVTLGPISPGPATLGARAPDYVGSALVSVPDVLEGPVRVPLTRGGTLHGEVVDARGYPVDGASVEVIGTDAQGLPIAETPLLVSFRQSHFAWALPGPPPLIPAGELGVMPGPVPPIPKGPGEGPPDPSATPSFEDAPPQIEPWVTRGNGHFTARPVTPGRIRALVRHPDFVEGTSEVVSLAPGGEAHVKVVLLRGGTLEGRVLDERGQPVSEAEVELVALRGTRVQTTQTARDGTFAFAAVPEEITISVSRGDDPGRTAVRKSLQVKEGAREKIEITLPGVREPVQVVVFDDTERPLELAQVTVMSLEPDVPLKQTLFTDEHGALQIDDARGLNLRLQIEAPGFARTSRTLSSAPGEVRVVLTRGVAVQGVITAVRGRRLVASAVVTLIADGVRKVATTNDDGVFKFSDVAPGNVRLLASHPEYADEAVSVEVKATGRADRPFEFEPIDLSEAGEVEGEVLSDRGDPVADARVAVGSAPAYLPAGALPPGVFACDSQGRFKMTGVKPGNVTIAAFSPSQGRGTARVEVSSGRTARGVRIRLSEGSNEDEPLGSGGVAVTLGERGSDATLEVVIVDVAGASEAERAGLQTGDVITAIDGVRPTSMADARGRLTGQNGRDVLLAISRAGTELSLRVTREAIRR